VTTPLPVLPRITVEAGLLPDAPVPGGTTLVLDDPALGLLDTGTLSAGIGWADISAQVLSFTVTRPSTRLQGPLWNYQAGTASILLDNSGGQFDPDNLAGPYVTAGVTQLVPMVPVRVRAAFGPAAYALYSGFADGWLPGQVTYEGGYAEITLPATDAFKVLAGVTLAAVASPEGVGADTGARVRDILARAGWYTTAERLAVDAGNSVLQGTTLGDTALALMQAAVDSEIGQLYVNGSGAVVFRARRALLTDARSNTVQAVFGDLPGTVQAAGTELACAAVGRSSDDTTIANDVQATRAGGTLQEVKDTASIARYLFPRTYARSDLILSADPDALNWANWVLYVSRGGEDRFDTLAVDPQADPESLWPQVLGREIGDRIQVWQRPAQSVLPYASNTVTSPAAFANILFLNVAPGTYAVSWTVTLAGTPGAADVNNFGLYNGTTFVAGSVNAGTPGVYPQAPVTMTVLPGAPDIKILAGGATPTAGAVYGAAVPAPAVKDCFIAGITHAWDSPSQAWLTTWTLQDASKYGSFLTLDNPTLGRLDFNALTF
jgi:hypothetical protein